MPTLEAGHVFERYRIIRWLGSGVSGESYEAEDSMLLRKVTLKLIHPQSTLPDSARRQFFRELQGISALNHPFLAPVLDYGEINSRLYIARKFVSSGSLLGTEGRLWFRPPFNLSDAIHYTHQLARTLHYIHTRGYLHGAITFSNILVLRGPNLDNEVDYAPFSLADVGLANFVRRFGQEPTPPLPVTAAPEQLSKRLTPASDQFALAVLLYFWLAGHPPYLGTPEEIEHLKLTEMVTPLSTLNTQISIEQSGILLRALSVHPGDRYPSILAFAEALLKTLPPVLPAIPKTEPAQFDDLAMQMPISTTSEHEGVADEQPEESVVAISTSTDDGHAMTTTTSIEEPVIQQFSTIPETDPAITFEPEALSENHVETSADQQILPAAAQETAQPVEIARVIITSPYADEPYEVKLEGDAFTIGRAGSSAILLDQDNLTSRHHALLKREGRRYLLFDMRSANGVLVNGQKIIAESGFELLDGDHISIGNYELIFRSCAPARESQTAAAELPQTANYEMTHLI
ncbi:MAG TPA: FHA domain-containing protein [Ktedonobacteraceae bacterium]|nr:FHA domain-containing protein [Ktedonobacteraceae bacterium]